MNNKKKFSRSISKEASKFSHTVGLLLCSKMILSMYFLAHFRKSWKVQLVWLVYSIHENVGGLDLERRIRMERSQLVLAGLVSVCPCLKPSNVPHVLSTLISGLSLL